MRRLLELRRIDREIVESERRYAEAVRRGRRDYRALRQALSRSATTPAALVTAFAAGLSGGLLSGDAKERPRLLAHRLQTELWLLGRAWLLQSLLRTGDPAAE